MIKAVASAMLTGAMVFVGMAGTDAADAIPTNLRAQFEQFWAESIPVDLRAQFNRFLIERNIAAFLNSRQFDHAEVKKAERSLLSEKADRQPLIRLAAANSDFLPETSFPEREAAMRVMIPSKLDCVLPISAAPIIPGKHFEIGDKVKLVFFENVQDVEKNKWGNAAGTGFQQHPELSGEYTVQDDGTISVPVLGSFDIISLTPKELQNLIAKAFDKALGGTGFVTIVSIERPPIYVLGPVKNPGSYTFSSGMSVLHAVTLAGGFPRQDTAEPWQKIEKAREQTKRYSTLESLSELLTRQAVLKSERDRGNPTPPPQLIELVGPTKAAAMISAEVDRRSGIVAARMAQLQTAAEAVKMAQQEVDQLSGKSRSFDAIDANVQALKRHADALNDLNKKGVITNYQVIDARTHVADAERNRQDIVNQLAQAKERLATAQQSRATLEANTRGELDTQILTLRQQIADAGRENMASEGVLSVLQVQYTTPPASAITYEIVRQTTKGPVAFVANGMSTLIPGDLVQVSTTEDAKIDPVVPSGQPNSRPVTTTPATVIGCR